MTTKQLLALASTLVLSSESHGTHVLSDGSGSLQNFRTWALEAKKRPYMVSEHKHKHTVWVEVRTRYLSLTSPEL